LGGCVVTGIVATKTIGDILTRPNVAATRCLTTKDALLLAFTCEPFLMRSPLALLH
jgi:hypothetical protein